MDISIQICTYNRKDILKKCLQALCGLNYSKEKFELILVDDGSEDGTSELIKSLKLSINYNYIYQPNQGLAIARNQGIKAAQGQYILFIDDDIIADSELLNEHLCYHKKYKKSVVKGWVNHVEDLENIQKPHFTLADFSTAFFWTSNVSVEKKYLIQAGLFNESFREYGWEDLELGLRLKKIGLTSRFNKKAVVYHYKKRWNKEELAKMIKISQSKARTAFIFLKINPRWRVKFATGLYPLRLFFNDLASFWGILEKFYKKYLDNRVGNLSGLSLFCARQLVKFAYFNELKIKLNKIKE